MNLQVDIRVSWWSNDLCEQQLCRVSKATFMKLNKDAVGIPAYFAVFGSELKPVIKVWPKHESEVCQKTPA